MNDKIDIVKLFEKNPIVRFTGTYQNKFIEKIKNSFTETQQNLFIGSFYCYLNYNSKTDFVVDLDSVWKWLGFSRKDPAKVVLEKHFTKDIDYKVSFAPATSGAKTENRGGSNKEKILLNVNAFKKLCLKSNTKKQVGTALNEIIEASNSNIDNQSVIKRFIEYCNTSGFTSKKPLYKNANVVSSFKQELKREISTTFINSKYCNVRSKNFNTSGYKNLSLKC